MKCFEIESALASEMTLLPESDNFLFSLITISDHKLKRLLHIRLRASLFRGFAPYARGVLIVSQYQSVPSICCRRHFELGGGAADESYGNGNQKSYNPPNHIYLCYSWNQVLNRALNCPRNAAVRHTQLFREILSERRSARDNSER